MNYSCCISHLVLESGVVFLKIPVPFLQLLHHLFQLTDSGMDTLVGTEGLIMLKRCLLCKLFHTILALVLAKYKNSLARVCPSLLASFFSSAVSRSNLVAILEREGGFIDCRHTKDYHSLTSSFSPPAILHASSATEG